LVGELEKEEGEGYYYQIFFSLGFKSKNSPFYILNRKICFSRILYYEADKETFYRSR